MNFGVEDTSYRAAGERAGIALLVNAFYDLMDTLPEASIIRAMHNDDLALSREKLIVFLSMWLGGPREYVQRFGPISIPAAHAHLDIGIEERDAWMLCMGRAVALQPWDEAFKSYFLAAIAVPAERVRKVCEARKG